MILNLIIEPNFLLHQVSKSVLMVDDEIRQLMDDMLESMYHYNGVGLAAVQVGQLKKVLVLDVGAEHSQGFKMPMCMVNAVISNFSMQTAAYHEGCLSFPGFYSEITRPADITVRYLDYHGNAQEITVKHGLLSVCIQHEIDHTNGKVFVDYLSGLKRNMIIKKLTKSLKHKQKESSAKG